jgi:hypothetical protein
MEDGEGITDGTSPACPVPKALPTSPSRASLREMNDAWLPDGRGCSGFRFCDRDRRAALVRQGLRLIVGGLRVIFRWNRER